MRWTQNENFRVQRRDKYDFFFLLVCRSSYTIFFYVCVLQALFWVSKHQKGFNLELNSICILFASLSGALTCFVSIMYGAWSIEHKLTLFWIGLKLNGADVITVITANHKGVIAVEYAFLPGHALSKQVNTGVTQECFCQLILYLWYRTTLRSFFI